MSTRRRAAGFALALSALLLAGCAAPVKTVAPGTGWSGRMALQVEGQASQSFSASFELQGSAREGELRLYTPLGGLASRIAWDAAGARLTSGDDTREFASLEALAAQATGAPIPVAPLFDWLAGIDTPVPGWQADLSRSAEGRIAAKRTTPPPAVDLRVILER